MTPHVTELQQINSTTPARADGLAEYDLNVQNWPGQNLVHDEMEHMSPMVARGRDSINGIVA